MAIAFELIRPNLDSSRRKAEGGRKGGLAGAEAENKPGVSRTEAWRKQDASEKENENETENEIEYENEYEYEIENKCPAAPRARETYEEVYERVKKMKEAGFFDRNKAPLRPKGSFKLNFEEGTEHAFDSG